MFSHLDPTLVCMSNWPEIITNFVSENWVCSDSGVQKFLDKAFFSVNRGNYID